jgi:hypothetical protein
LDRQELVAPLQFHEELVVVALQLLAQELLEQVVKQRVLVLALLQVQLQQVQVVPLFAVLLESAEHLYSLLTVLLLLNLLLAILAYYF